MAKIPDVQEMFEEVLQEEKKWYQLEIWIYPKE